MISPLLNQTQLAEILGVTEWTVWSLRRRKLLPPAIKLGSSLRWQESTIMHWIQTSEAPCHQIDPILSNRAERAAAGRGQKIKNQKELPTKKIGRPSKKEQIEGRKS